MSPNDAEAKPPCVHITYDVEEDGKVKTVELPFVIGVLADLSGQQEPVRLKDRKFVEVNRGNFEAVVAAWAPRLRLVVANRLERHGDPLKIELQFRSMADFEPEGVARQFTGMAALLEAGHAGAADQLDEILHAPAFQRLEASWRGVRYLVSSADPDASVKVRVFNVTRQELLSDFREAEDLDRNVLFQKVYLEQFGIFGGQPFSVIMGDYEFSNAADDLELLDGLAQVAALAGAPFLAAAGARMFGCADFAELSQKRNLSKIFEGPAYAHWRSFRQSGQAGFVALVLPRILLRLPYGITTSPAQAFSYQESMAETGGANWLWGNAAFALAARLADAFRRYHWCAAITGPEGGMMTDLPAFRYRDSNGNPAIEGPMEALFDDVQPKQLWDCGFNCLLQRKGTDQAAFLGLTTCLRPKLYQETGVNTAARLGTLLPYVLAISRFAQYLKVIMRDSARYPSSKEECERRLNEWLRQYVIEDDSASPEVKARFPLREARVKVEKTRDYSGYQATVSLRPHFQLADPGFPLRMVVELPVAAR
jgi:type VI secretion system protein ImpC